MKFTFTNEQNKVDIIKDQKHEIVFCEVDGNIGAVILHFIFTKLFL